MSLREPEQQQNRNKGTPDTLHTLSAEDREMHDALADHTIVTFDSVRLKGARRLQEINAAHVPKKAGAHSYNSIGRNGVAFLYKEIGLENGVRLPRHLLEQLLKNYR